jgi:hypothetical protein
MPRLVPLVDRAAAIARLQALTAERGRRVTRGEFSAATGLSNFQMIREFGGYNGLLRAAGFAPHLANQKIPDDDLLRMLRDACLTAGHIVSQTEFDRLCTKGASHGRFKPYHRRWGRWPQVLAALRVWVEKNDPDFLHRDGLPGAESVPDPGPKLPPPARRYGAPLNFRGVLHEPVNEPGVILLFGVLARDLGFAIESVHASFPDCEAKRCTGLNVWERVRIEFEYESRNFKVHGHDAGGCDLIVCWAHTWPDCPLEVLELRAEVEKRRHEVPIQVLPAWARGVGRPPNSLARQGAAEME